MPLSVTYGRRRPLAMATAWPASLLRPDPVVLGARRGAVTDTVALMDVYWREQAKYCARNIPAILE